MTELRFWVTMNRIPLLIAAGILTVASQGLLHASFYARGKRKFLDVHGASEILGALHFITLYIAGVGIVQAFGATLIGIFFFQGLINLGSGLPFVNPNEEKDYEAFNSKLLQIKRWAVGYWRYAKLGLGVLLLFLQYLIDIPLFLQ